MAVPACGEQHTESGLSDYHSREPPARGQDRPPGPGPSQRGRLGSLVAGSLVTGVIAAMLLAGAPVIPATESGVTGAVLAGLGLGRALVAVLSVRFAASPKMGRGPALFLGGAVSFW